MIDQRCNWLPVFAAVNEKKGDMLFSPGDLPVSTLFSLGIYHCP
jgi:hypothetical protein